MGAIAISIIAGIVTLGFLADLNSKKTKPSTEETLSDVIERYLKTAIQPKNQKSEP